MLIFGDYTCIPRGEVYNCYKDNIIILNFTSYIQEFPTLSNLLPSKVGVNIYDPKFDELYLGYILSNDDAFDDFMIIVNALYSGNHVYICVNKGDFYDTLTESLYEAIKNRYGYIGYFINDYSEYDYLLTEYSNFGDFSVSGLYIYDNDKARSINRMIDLGLVKAADLDD